MLRLVKMGGKWFGITMDEDLDELEAIKSFADQGDPVVIVGELEDARSILNADGFNVDDIEIAD